MNAERLLAHFERISEAPDAIARLRRFILDLAVRGKLVEQDPGDEPAEDLLGRILELKIRSTGKLPKSNSQMIDRLFDDEPFAIPDSWAWVVLGQITDLITSGSRDWAKHYSNSGAIFVRMGNLVKGDYRLRLDSIQHVSPPAGGEGTRTRLEAWDVLVSITGDVGMLGLIPEGFGEAYINQHTALARPCFLLKGRYLPEFLRSDFAQNQFQEPQRGIKNSFRLSDLSAIVVPLPPLAEQHRIVAKVDTLLALCDQLEAARQQRQQSRDRLIAATLQPLNQPADALASFRQDASFALQVLPSLTTTPAQIKQLRQTILNLAVRGKLVEQDPEDGPADVRLVQIQRALSSTIASMGLRLKRSSSPAASPEGDFAGVPSSWALSTLGSLAIVLDPNPSHRYPSYDGGTVPILSTQEFSGLDGWDPSTAKLVPHSFFEYQLANCRFERGDIVFARKGRLGLPRLLPNFEQFTFSHTVFLVKPMPGVFPEYLLWLLRRDQVIAWLTNEMNANTGVPTLGKEKMERLPIPLPPLAEQHRIVAKVDELMALCDQLEQQLSQADQQRRRLLEALLAEALGGRLPIEQEESHAAIA
jgi:type I restriction enzyme S subunit